MRTKATLPQYIGVNDLEEIVYLFERSAVLTRTLLLVMVSPSFDAEMQEDAAWVLSEGVPQILKVLRENEALLLNSRFAEYYNTIIEAAEQTLEGDIPSPLDDPSLTP